MSQVKPGDTVRLHYTGKLDDGTEFDSSAGRDPLEFTVGSGQIIPGLDQAVSGMEVGESKTVTVPPEQAYGDHDPARQQSVPRDQIPDHIPTMADDNRVGTSYTMAYMKALVKRAQEELGA